MSKSLPALLAAAFAAAAAVSASGLHAQAAAPESQAPAEQQVDLSRIEDVPTLLAMARDLQAERAWPQLIRVWQRIRSLRIHNPHYVYELAAAFAQAGEMTQGYNALLVLQQGGAAYDIGAEPRFSNLHGTEVWDYLVKLYDDARDKPFGSGQVAFELPPADLLLESIAHDPTSDSFLFGSARDGVIYRRGGNGRLQPWARPQGDAWWSIFDVKVDVPRKRVWATTAAVPHFKDFKAADAGRAALLEIDLEDGSLVRAHAAPDDGLPHVLSGIALSPRGDIIVAEGLRGQLFRKAASGGLEPFMAERRLNALRGLTFSEDGNTLYFADYEMGLFGIDLSRGMAFDLEYPGTVILHGIEGLYTYQGQLLAIQSGTVPQRVIRLKLDEAGRKIEAGVPIEANQPAFAGPTLGTVVGDDLYFIANSQRGFYDGFGLLRGGRELPPVKVYRSNARVNWDFKPPSLPESVGPGAIRPGGGD